jgi:hypothetical protein
MFSVRSGSRRAFAASLASQRSTPPCRFVLFSPGAENPECTDVCNSARLAMHERISAT